MKRLIATRLLPALVCVTVGLIAAGSAAADTSSLNPPPPPWYSCMANGSGTFCHVQGHVGMHFAGFDGTCSQGFDILENGYTNETAARYYDRDGNLIRRVLHDFFPLGNPLNVLYNSETGKSIPYGADVTESDNYTVPGDIDSAIARVTGNLYTLTLPSDGLLVHDVGLFTFAPDGSVLEDHGPKMLFFGQTDKLCAALA